MQLQAACSDEVNKLLLEYVRPETLKSSSELGLLECGRQLTLLNVVSISKRLSVTYKQIKQAWEEQKCLGCLVVAPRSIEY